MPRDLVSAIKALRKDQGSSVQELEEAVLELAHRVQQLQDDLDELREKLEGRSR